MMYMERTNIQEHSDHVNEISRSASAVPAQKCPLPLPTFTITKTELAIELLLVSTGNVSRD